MLRMEDFAVIKALHECGVYKKDTAAGLGVHPKAVSHAHARGDARSRSRKPRGSKRELGDLGRGRGVVPDALEPHSE